MIRRELCQSLPHPWRSLGSQGLAYRPNSEFLLERHCKRLRARPCNPFGRIEFDLAALRVVGLRQPVIDSHFSDGGFQNLHQVLNRLIAKNR